MNLTIYCDRCDFQTNDPEEAKRHAAANRNHEILPVRLGETTPETHTHYCQLCAERWGCDDPCCMQPEVWGCDRHSMAMDR